ncbi:hypothetical protein [Streptomyces sp. 3211]|uniref:hypothetical protein n=1 Tax=Streptomyces sp. 3211 TaxID=1964449 RepID=UPI00184E912A|nr:hypothetical protein [Streptomyces sp. 3211]
MPSLTAGNTGRPGLLAYVNGLRFIEIEPFDTAAALSATELLHAGHPWATVHAIHAARPSADFPASRYLLTLGDVGVAPVVAGLIAADGFHPASRPAVNARVWPPWATFPDPAGR